jgi:hypothetical protein
MEKEAIGFSETLVYNHWITLTLITENYNRNIKMHHTEGRKVGFRVPVRVRLFSSPRHLEWFWGPPRLLCNGYRGLFFSGAKKTGREAKYSAITVPRSRIRDLYIHSTIRLHAIVLSSLNTRKLFFLTLPYRSRMLVCRLPSSVGLFVYWRWRQNVPLKPWLPGTRLLHATIQLTTIFVLWQ